jgi:hypothetical protein
MTNRQHVGGSTVEDIEQGPVARPGRATRSEQASNGRQSLQEWHSPRASNHRSSPATVYNDRGGTITLRGYTKPFRHGADIHPNNHWETRPLHPVSRRNDKVLKRLCGPLRSRGPQTPGQSLQQKSNDDQQQMHWPVSSQPPYGSCCQVFVPIADSLVAARRSPGRSLGLVPRNSYPTCYNI